MSRIRHRRTAAIYGIWNPERTRTRPHRACHPVCRFTVPRVTVGPGMVPCVIWLCQICWPGSEASDCMRHIFVSHLFAPHAHLPSAIFSISSPSQGLDEHRPCACLLPYLFDPCGWESQQCMQQQQGAHSFLCGVRISESNVSPPSSVCVVLTLPHVLSPSSPQSHPSSTKTL